MTNKKELLLIKKSIKDNSSFKLLIKKYNSLISYYATYFYLEGHGSDDIRNMILTIIWKSLKDYNPNKSSFNSYISKKITLSFFALIRDGKVQKRSPLRLLSLDATFPTRSKGANEDFSLLEIITDDKLVSYEDKEEFSYLNGMLLLVLSHKEALVYNSLKNRYSRKEMAYRLKCSIKSIENSLDRIKTKAKGIYEQYIRKTRND